MQLPARPEPGTGAGAATARTPARRAGRAQHSPGTPAADPETHRDHNGSLPLPRNMGSLAAENARAACVDKQSLAARPSGSGSGCCLARHPTPRAYERERPTSYDRNRVARSVAPPTSNAAAMAGAMPTVVATTASAAATARPTQAESLSEYRTRTAPTRRSSFINTLLRSDAWRLRLAPLDPIVRVSVRATSSTRATLASARDCARRARSARRARVSSRAGAVPSGTRALESGRYQERAALSRAVVNTLAGRRKRVCGHDETAPAPGRGLKASGGCATFRG